MIRRKNYFSIQAGEMAKPATGTRKVKWLRYVLLGAAVFGIYHILSGPSGALNLMGLRKANLRQAAQLDSLQARKQELAAEKIRLEKDSAYLEMVARKELGMAKPEEKVFRYMKKEKSPEKK
jgi:cell division protein FtsB